MHTHVESDNPRREIHVMKSTRVKMALALLAIIAIWAIALVGLSTAGKPFSKVAAILPATQAPTATFVPTATPTATITSLPTITLWPTITSSPTPTSVPASAGLFSDDFQDGMGDKWSSSVGTWVVKKDETGHYVYEGSGPNNYPQTWPAQHSSQNWTDYAFESRIRIVKGGVFVCIRANGSSFYNVFLEDNGSIALAKWINGNYTVVQNTNYPIVDNQWYLVRVEIVGQIYSLYIDNNPVTTYSYEKDSPVVSGTIAYYIGGGDVVQIRDVRVWSLGK